MSGPGDGTTKYVSLEEPTPSRSAEGHDPAPNSADLEQAFLPGSESSARSQMSPAREPGDLEGASGSVVGPRQPREGKKPQAAGNALEKSDEVVVPKKSTKTRVTPVEPMEGRTEAEGKSAARNAPPTQCGTSALTALQRIGQRAKATKRERFTNLLSHVKLPLLKEAYQRLRKDAATGVDKVTWLEYGERLEERLQDLETRVHRGSYHPLPVRRVHIPKGDGSTRPLGIPALEDKVLQQAVRMVLEPVYEAQFVGFSYGFRPGRSPHRALDALAVAIGKKVSWVLDADIRSFFNTIDHGWMQRFVEHRIGDRRLVRLLMKWLKAGVMEDGELHEVQEGTPQGGIISPLLANIYLHYALDLWVQSWRKKHARGEVYVVRYADDFAMAFQREQDARAMHAALAERLAKFDLELHPDKTRVIRFGRFARQDCERDGLKKPATFDFLGFTHISSVDRTGEHFQLKRRTSRKKKQAKLVQLREQMRIRRHDPIAKQHAWLASVLTGHYRYYGVPTNYASLGNFREEVERSWYGSLQRRSQRARWNKARREAVKERFPLPMPHIHHPWPQQRLAVR
jgi:RNA-directed DNA polymerase